MTTTSQRRGRAPRTPGSDRDPEGGHGADRRGTTRRLEGGDERDQHPGDEAEPEHGRGDRRSVELDAARRPEPGRRDLREEPTEDEPDGGAEDAQQRGLDEDDPDDLAARGAGGAEQPELRIRSTTVIASVLRIRNAAANRVIAASSAIVERMSAVDARSEAATSRGEETTYGSRGQRLLERCRDRGRIRPAARTRSIRVSPSTARPAARRRRSSRRVQPVERGGVAERQDDGPSRRPGHGAVAGEDADDRRRDRRARPEHGELGAEIERSAEASRSVTSAGSRPSASGGAPRASVRSRTRGSRGGSTPRTVTGSWVGGAPGPRAEVRPPLDGWRRQRDAGDALGRGERPIGQARLGKRGDAQVGPTDERGDRAVDRSVEARVDRERRDEHGDPDARRRTPSAGCGSGARRGSARRTGRGRASVAG